MERFDRLGMKPDYAEAQKVQRGISSTYTSLTKVLF